MSEIINSTEDDYFPALARVVVGEAKLLGERQAPDGSREILVGGATLANRPIGFDDAFWKTPLRTYADWPERWFREVIQNSVDAGAHNIDLRCFAQANAQGQVSWFVECQDDAGGMPLEVLHGKFLSLGGSGKAGVAGATGGFGKAKELILFPWMSFSVHTRDKRVFGWVEEAGTKYGVQDEDAPFLSGTKVTVLMSPDEHTDIAAAIAYIKKCYTPNVRFRVTGVFDALKSTDVSTRTIHADLEVDQENLVHTITHQGRPVMEIYHMPRARMSDGVSKLLIRDRNGLFMFSKDVSYLVKGLLIATVLVPTVDVLSDSRDRFRIEGIETSLYRFLGSLERDAEQALEKKKKKGQKIIYPGKGKFISDEKQLEAAMLSGMDWHKTPGKPTKLTTEQINGVAQKIEDLGAGADQLENEVPARMEDQPIPPEASPPMEYRPVSEAIKVMLSAPISGPAHFETIVKQASWEPAFIIIPNPLTDEEDIYRVPAKFKPEGMSARLRKLARLWGEVCRFVLMCLNSRQEFGIGWIFDKGAQAAYYRHQDGSHWLVLNPFKGRVERQKRWDGEDAGYNKTSVTLGGEVFNPHSDEDLDILVAAAIHEATHFADGYQQHDTSFATALTYNIVKTMGRGNEARYRRIKKAVLKRTFKVDKFVQEQPAERPESQPLGDYPRYNGFWEYVFRGSSVTPGVLELAEIKSPADENYEDVRERLVSDLDFPKAIKKAYWKTPNGAFKIIEKTLGAARVKWAGAMRDFEIPNQLSSLRIMIYRSDTGGDPE